MDSRKADRALHLENELQRIGLFDPDYYLRQLSGYEGDPFTHFLTAGDAAGLDPSPYFSTTYYKTRYFNWSDGGAATALEDFLAREQVGAFRQVHPLIDPSHYNTAHPDVAQAGVSPTIHFAMYGDREGRSPSNAFDAAFYTRCYLPLGHTRAFAHYVSEGKVAGLLAKPAIRSQAETTAAMADAVRPLPAPVILALHDAQAAGTPILLRDFGVALATRGYNPLFVLQNGGPLADELRRIGPVFLLAEGWDCAALFAALPRPAPVLVNSAAAVEIAIDAAKAGLRTVLLIHEMREYLVQQDLLPKLRLAQQLGTHLIVSFPVMAEAVYEDLGELEVLLPGLPLPSTVLTSFRQARHRFSGKLVFIGAGHADMRKGFDVFLEAAFRIHSKRPESVFVWLGARDAWAESLADAAMGQGLPLNLPGFVTDSLAWYHAADLYLLTSRQDPGPGTALHAASVGTGFVAYDTDIGMKDVAADLGEFLPVGDVAAFARTAIRLATSDTAETRRRRRAEFRRLSDFDSYVTALLSRLTLAP